MNNFSVFCNKQKNLKKTLQEKEQLIFFPYITQRFNRKIGAKFQQEKKKHSMVLL